MNDEMIRFLAAVTDANMRRRATDLGEKIRAEDGIGRAVQFIAMAVAGNFA